MSMIRIYQNHSLQTNPQHHEEDPQNINSKKTKDDKSKATNSLFLIKMIANLERTQK